MKQKCYSSDFILLRRAIFMNFIAQSAPIREEDLTPETCFQLIYDIGEDYVRRNKRGFTILPEVKVHRNLDDQTNERL